MDESLHRFPGDCYIKGLASKCHARTVRGALDVWLCFSPGAAKATPPSRFPFHFSLLSVCSTAAFLIFIEPCALVSGSCAVYRTPACFLVLRRLWHPRSFPGPVPSMA